MNQNRRDFIKFIVAGSVASGCPIDLALVAAPDAAGGPSGASYRLGVSGAHATPEVDGEHNEICHQIRDGRPFAHPPVSERHDVVIVGGGPSGLTAAHLLQRHDFLLLEKEPHWGGNAYLEEYDGQAYATGAAFVDGGERAALELTLELGLEVLPVNNSDGSILRGEFVPDTWGAGLDHLPYSESVRASFKKFRREAGAVVIQGREPELDSQPFAKYFEGYAPEVKLWWDTFGPSNWGARTEETSALLGLRTVREIAGDFHDGRVTWPGGLGAISARLVSHLQAKEAGRMRAGTTIVSVRDGGREAEVTYFRAGQLKTVGAKAVIMATPKFITRRLVEGLPPEQAEAMKQIRYIPYPVINLIFSRPVFDKGYDTWCPGNTFTDFIVADWTVARNKPGYRRKSNILTFYTPLAVGQRALLLTEEGARGVAGRVLADFQKLFPGSNADPLEVHIYRRGHPLYMSAPGMYTRVQPLARRPMGRIAFANTDSEGPISSTDKAIVAARRAVGEAQQALASGRIKRS